MYEIKRGRRGRLLTASSLALALILTAGTGWAQSGNNTIGDGGTVTDPGDVSKPLTVQGALGTTADLTLGTDVVASVLGANGDVETITVDGAGQTLTLSGVSHGNLVENTDTEKAINLGIGTGTTVEVVGTSGLIGDITGMGAGSTFVVENGAVTAGNISNISLFLDPSVTVAESFVNSNAYIGDRSVLYVAGNYTADRTEEDAEAWLMDVLNDVGITGTGLDNLNWAGANINHGQNTTTGPAITSVLAISAPTTIDSTRKYLVDGQYNRDTPANEAAWISAITAQTEAAVFGAGSLFVVDAAALGNNAALTVDAGHPDRTAVIDDDASLYIVNVQVDKTLNILDGFTSAVDQGGTVISSTSNQSGWDNNWTTGSKILNDAGQLLVNGTTGDATFYIDSDDINAANSFSGGRMTRDTASALNRFHGKNGTSTNYFDPNSGNAGIKFVSRATSDLYLYNGNNAKQVVTTLEGAQAMAATAGVQTSTYSIAQTLAGNYNARLSYLNDQAPSGGSGDPGTIGIWINPFYNSTSVDGVSIGRHNAEYDFDYGGATLGIDSNINENFRLGVAFSVGGGDTESKGGNFNKTDSDFDFWGLGVYGSYTNGMFGLTGDISYSAASYDIEQRLHRMNMNKLESDVDTDTFTVGLTGEYRFITESNLNIIPHLGLRYYNLKTDGFHVKEKGRGSVFRISSETQNIWTIPLGVTFTGDINTDNGWVIQPKADLGVIFATGDLDYDSKYRIDGANYRGTTVADDVVDSVTFNGLIGLKAENCDGFSVGLDYNFKASDNLTSHGVTGTIRYDF